MATHREHVADQDVIGLPPHCDSMDGPVVAAARRALAAEDVTLVLPFVQEDGEPEVGEAVERFDAMRAAEASAAAGVPAARSFVEAMLGLQVWAHKLYGGIHAPAHGDAARHGHG